MTTRRRLAALRSWLGVVAAALALASAAWMTFEYVRAARAEPVERVLVESLKERARTDAAVHETLLQPEFDRQRDALIRRHRLYRILAPVMLLSQLVVLAWVRWLRPAPADWVGVPRQVRLLFGANLDHPPPRGGMSGASGSAAVDVAPLMLTSAASAARPIAAADVDAILDAEGRQTESVIPVLQAIQARYRYLPDEALRWVAEASAMTPAQIAGVASFYRQFRQTPVGEHVIRVCEGTACHVSGAVEVRSELRRCLGMRDHEDTDPARQFTVERVACVGSCSLAPVMTIDERIYGRLSALSAVGALRGFVADEADGEGHAHANGAGTNGAGHSKWSDAGEVEIRIGLGSCGIASGALAVQAAIEDAVRRLGGGASVKAVGCAGLCHSEPLVEVLDGDRRFLYGHVSPADARKLVREHVRSRGLVPRVRAAVGDVHARLADDNAWVPVSTRAVESSAYTRRQVRIVLENCGEVDPLSLDDYRAREGFQALEACLSRSPAQVIEEIRASGLRGRGGAGFPAAVKWDLTRRAQGDRKFVIANGDEGDPGAFMDRAVLEADPFRVIEGLAIAAYAVGAREGVVYVRREYPLAVRHVRAAIESATAAGLLGERMLGSDVSLVLQVREGAGAFVCGEETALIQSLEGHRGMPRPRPPYPAESGYRGRPTLINNVETLACIPWILRKGAAAFAALGTERSTGTKVFSLAGKIARGGLIEVPMGISVREIVEEIGGGIKDGRRFKGVLAGGPSGGCIPAALADTRIDYEDLASTGAIMGSGGLVVLDDRDCAVDIARFFLHFTQDESCGKCTFCRIGTRRMLEILERICAGHGRPGDIDTLQSLGEAVKKGSLCGLGQTAPNPVLTTLRYYRDEYEAHIHERRCPAGSCKALVHYRVLDACTGCTLCAQACPVSAIERRPYERHQVIDDRCTRCGMCLTACPEQAIEVA